MITIVKTVAVYVSDQKEAVRFYTQQLRFEVRQTESMGPGGSWIEARVGYFLHPHSPRCVTRPFGSRDASH